MTFLSVTGKTSESASEPKRKSVLSARSRLASSPVARSGWEDGPPELGEGKQGARESEGLALTDGLHPGPPAATKTLARELSPKALFSARTVTNIQSIYMRGDKNEDADYDDD